MNNSIHPETIRLNSLLKKYSSSVSIDVKKETLSEVEGEALFEVIVDDYIQGGLTVDDLSLLCEMTYSKFSLETDLYSLLLMGAEIEWYIRHEPFLAASAIEDLLSKFSKEGPGKRIYNHLSPEDRK